MRINPYHYRFRRTSSEHEHDWWFPPEDRATNKLMWRGVLVLVAIVVAANVLHSIFA